MAGATQWTECADHRKGSAGETEGGGRVERHRALLPRLAGPVLKQILPAALPVASHSGARAERRHGFLGLEG